jgi:rhamnogalacturonyl hydrolase YesR
LSVKCKIVLCATLSFSVVLPVFGRRHPSSAPLQPPQRIRAELLANSERVIARAIALHPKLYRNHWQDGVLLMGMLETAAAKDQAAKGSGEHLTNFVAAVVESRDWDNLPDDCSAYHGDCTAFTQVVLKLLETTSQSDPRRTQWRSTLVNPLSFARHALRDAPAESAPVPEWWIDGGYGTRFWVDDLYTIQPWLAMMASTKEGMPGDPLARDLAYEMLESCLFDHRPDSGDARERAVPTSRVRRGKLLWNAEESLLEHDPTTAGGDDRWGRGNGWGIYGIAHTLEYLDRPYEGGRYDEVVSRADLEKMFVSFAYALKNRRTPDGGWSPHLGLAHLGDCPVAEMSATGLITYGLAWGINTGRLPRDVFVPVVLRAAALLQTEIDATGDVLDIQPSAGGPVCAFWSSNQSDPIYNMNYGIGALVLTNMEVMKFRDEDLYDVH